MMVTASLFWSAIRNRYYYIVSTAIFFLSIIDIKTLLGKKMYGIFFVWTRFYYCDVLFFTPGIWTRGWPDGKLQKLSGCRPTSPAILISLVGKPVVYKNNRDLRIKTEPVVGQILYKRRIYTVASAPAVTSSVHVWESDYFCTVYFGWFAILKDPLFVEKETIDAK